MISDPRCDTIFMNYDYSILVYVYLFSELCFLWDT